MAAITPLLRTAVGLTLAAAAAFVGVWFNVPDGGALSLATGFAVAVLLAKVVAADADVKAGGDWKNALEWLADIAAAVALFFVLVAADDRATDKHAHRWIVGAVLVVAAALVALIAWKATRPTQLLEGESRSADSLDKLKLMLDKEKRENEKDLLDAIEAAASHAGASFVDEPTVAWPVGSPYLLLTLKSDTVTKRYAIVDGDWRVYAYAVDVDGSIARTPVT